MRLRFWLLTLTVLALVAPAFAAKLSREDLKKALDANPDIVLDVLRHNKKAFFEVITQAAQEEQTRRRQEAEEAEFKEIDEHIKNPVVAAITDKSHIRGNAKAKLTLVEYSDFQCPYCRRGYDNVEALRKKYGDRLRLVFKNKPLPMHSQAMPAAMWFEAAARLSPDKAWALHDKFFENQDKLGEPFFKETAKAAGYDVDKLAKEVQDPAVKEAVEADIKEAETLGFDGTPGFLLNGVPIRGAYPVERFDLIIQKIDAAKGK